MKTLPEYQTLLHEYMCRNAEKYGISRMAIFGSVARGEQTEDSDVDICIEGSPMGLFAWGRLKSELEQLLGCRVDLLRMHKQLEGSYFQKNITEDFIYV